MKSTEETSQRLDHQDDVIQQLNIKLRAAEEREAQLRSMLESLRKELNEFRKEHAGHAARVNAEVQTFRKKFESLSKPHSVVPLLDGLSPCQRSVLEALQLIPDGDLKEAETLLAQLEGQAASEPLIKSITAILRHKKWRVTCRKCSAPSGLYWAANLRYSNGGHSQFSHTDTSGRSVTHCSMTRIPSFLLQFGTRHHHSGFSE